MAIIELPIIYVPDPLKGRPLFNSQIFIGEPDLDPEVVINQKQLNVVQEDGTVVAVGQPFVVGAGGVPIYNGSTVRLDVDGNYSLKILDNLGAQKYYIENVIEGIPITEAELIADLSQAYEFATVAEYKAFTTAFPVGKIVNLLDREASFTVISGTGTANAFDIIASSSVSQSISMTVEKGVISTKQLGTTKIASDFNALQHACNNSAWSTIVIENYSPIGGVASVNRSNLIFDGLNQKIDFTGVSNAMLVLGQELGGGVPASSILNIDTRNIQADGDKTAGSRIIFYRKASTCTHHNWRVSGLATPFNGDGFIGTYESIVCKFYDMDFRNNIVGWDDSVGSFQASTFYGGRIESNDEEGVICKSSNVTFDGTVIEGNVKGGGGESQVTADGGGSLKFIGGYMERAVADTNKAFITVAALSTKRISLLGVDFYGQDAANALLVTGSDWSLGYLSIKGCQINDVHRLCDRAGAVGNWYGNFDYWAGIALQDPTTTLNGATFTDNNRVDGLKAHLITAVTRIAAENLQAQQSGSAGFTREFQRFIGRVTVGGAGDWHQVIDLSDVNAAASTAIRFDLYFTNRAADFYFYTTINLSGIATLGTKEDVSGNWTSSLYRINAGFLEVDNLPATNRDWTCRIVATKAALS